MKKILDCEKMYLMKEKGPNKNDILLEFFLQTQDYISTLIINKGLSQMNRSLYKQLSDLRDVILRFCEEICVEDVSLVHFVHYFVTMKMMYKIDVCDQYFQLFIPVMLKNFEIGFKAASLSPNDICFFSNFFIPTSIVNQRAYQILFHHMISLNDIDFLQWMCHLKRFLSDFCPLVISVLSEELLFYIADHEFDSKPKLLKLFRIFNVVFLCKNVKSLPPMSCVRKLWIKMRNSPDLVSEVLSILLEDSSKCQNPIYISIVLMFLFDNHVNSTLTWQNVVSSFGYINNDSVYYFGAFLAVLNFSSLLDVDFEALSGISPFNAKKVFGDRTSEFITYLPVIRSQQWVYTNSLLSVEEIGLKPNQKMNFYLFDSDDNYLKYDKESLFAILLSDNRLVYSFYLTINTIMRSIPPNIITNSLMDIENALVFPLLKTESIKMDSSNIFLMTIHEIFKRPTSSITVLENYFHQWSDVLFNFLFSSDYCIREIAFECLIDHLMYMRQGYQNLVPILCESIKKKNQLFSETFIIRIIPRIIKTLCTIFFRITNVEEMPKEKMRQVLNDDPNSVSVKIIEIFLESQSQINLVDSIISLGVDFPSHLINYYISEVLVLIVELFVMEIRNYELEKFLTEKLLSTKDFDPKVLDFLLEFGLLMESYIISLVSELLQSNSIFHENIALRLVISSGNDFSSIKCLIQTILSKNDHCELKRLVLYQGFRYPYPHGINFRDSHINIPNESLSIVHRTSIHNIYKDTDQTSIRISTCNKYMTSSCKICNCKTNEEDTLAILGFDYSFQSSRYLPKDQRTISHLKTLYTKSTRSCHKIGILYVKKGQRNQIEVLDNSMDDISSSFADFLKAIGWTIDLSTHQSYTGGLDISSLSNGKTSIFHADSQTEIMFHVGPLLLKAEKDPQCVSKKRHIGNDRVHIIWSDDTIDYDTRLITSQFNHAHIIIYPVHNYFIVQVVSKNEVPYFPIINGSRIISKDILPAIVRFTACRADMASSSSIEAEKQHMDELLEAVFTSSHPRINKG